jgi:uncharacterized protein YjcR
MARPMVSRVAVRVLLAEGKKTKEIAERMGCSAHTIADIRRQLKEADEARARSSYVWKPLEGVRDVDASSLMAHLSRGGMTDIAVILGLIPDPALTVDLRPEEEKAA